METEQAIKIYSEISNQLFVEINKIRTNPKSYISILQEIINNNFDKNDDKILIKDENKRIILEEGKQAFINAIEYLSKIDSVAELKISSELSQAAVDHVTDIGIHGIFSHDGSDGIGLIKRVERYCEWDTALAENILFNEDQAQNILIGFIVDDGDSTRTQRNNIFNDEYKYIGLSSGDHFSEMNNCTVVVFAVNTRPKGTKPIIYEKEVDLKSKSKFHPKKTSFNESNNYMQEQDPDAPDDALSVKYQSRQIVVEEENYKVTQKIYTLKDGSTHIVEVIKKDV